MPQEEPSEICVALSKNLVLHDQSKHIDTRYHFIRECIARKEVQIKFVKSQDQAVDIFTKPLKQEDFVKFRSSVGVTRSSLKGCWIINLIQVLAYIAIIIDFDDNKPHVLVKQRFMYCAFIIKKNDFMELSCFSSCELK